MMKYKFSFLSGILTVLFILFVTLSFRYYNIDLKLSELLNFTIDKWVSIATICTAISSIVIGLVTVWVMIDQQKKQNELIKYQKFEHQPTFIVKISEHYGGDENFNDASFEDLKIKSIGYQQYIIKEIKINTFITLTNNHYKNPFIDRIRLYDYFYKKMGGNDDAIIIGTSNREKRNLAKYNSITNLFYKSPRTEPGMCINKDIMVEIEYIDVYEEEHIKYFQNGYPVDETTYKKNSRYNVKNEVSIDDFDILEYLKQYNLQTNQS